MTEKSYTLNLTMTVPAQVLMDILTTACEGGSTYWLMAHSIERDEKLNVLQVVQPLDAETGKRFDTQNFTPDHLKGRLDNITLGTVHAGLQLLLNGALPGRSDLVRQVTWIPADAHDFDAGDADVIVQLGFFGRLVFG